MRGLDSITVSIDVKIDAAQANPYFIYGFGNTIGTAGNGYLFTTGNSYRTSIASGNWSTEQNTRTAGTNLQRAVWKHDHLHPDRHHGRALRGRRGGRPQHRRHHHPRLHRRGHDHRQLHRQVGLPRRQPLQGQHPRLPRLQPGPWRARRSRNSPSPSPRSGVAADKAALTLGDTSAVTADLTLPSAGPAGGSAITWATDNASVVSSSGVVTRPAAGQPAATPAHGDPEERPRRSDTARPSTSRSRPPSTTTTATQQAADALTVPNIDDVRGNITLPSTGGYGTAVAWPRRTRTSSRPTAWCTAPRTAPAAPRSI